MAPKCDQSEKDTPPGKKNSRTLITLEQKMDILKRYKRGESTADISRVFHLRGGTLYNIRKNSRKILRQHREKTKAAVKAE